MRSTAEVWQFVLQQKALLAKYELRAAKVDYFFFGAGVGLLVGVALGRFC